MREKKSKKKFLEWNHLNLLLGNKLEWKLQFYLIVCATIRHCQNYTQLRNCKDIVVCHQRQVYMVLINATGDLNLTCMFKMDNFPYLFIVPAEHMKCFGFAPVLSGECEALPPVGAPLQGLL